MAHSGLDRVRQGLKDAAISAGRDPATVTLIAVSKTFDIPEIEPVIAAGQLVFGENRVQESKAKWPGLKDMHPELKLHLIGPLQSNKAAEAVGLFDAIHTIDRPRIAQAVAAEMNRQQKSLQLFVQVNTGLEPQKAGVSPADCGSFIEDCRTRLGLAISGLMCIPPVAESPTAHFMLLADIAKRHGLSQLSMGMSSDYAEAINCGATHVRVGSAIFGGRS